MGPLTQAELSHETYSYSVRTISSVWAGLLTLALCDVGHGQNVRVIMQPWAPAAQVAVVGAQLGAPGIQAPSLSLSRSQTLPSSLALPLPNPGLLSASGALQPSAQPAAQGASPAAVQQHAAAPAVQAAALAAGPVRTLQAPAALEPVGYHNRNKPVFVQPSAERRARRDVKPTASQNARDARQAAGKQEQGRSLDRFSVLYDGADLRAVRAAAVPVSPSAAVRVERQGRFAVGLQAADVRSRDYLAEAEGKVGTQLLEALHNISGRGIRVSNYKETSRYMFSVADNVVERGVRGVRDVYSGIFVAGNGEIGDTYRERGDQNGDGYSNDMGMNVEHAWPQSYFGRSQPMRSDLHHLMPAFEHANSERSNYPFGEVDDRDAIYRTNGGAKLGKNSVFEPPDAFKGRVARALLYFYMRYYNRSIFPRGTAESFWNSRIEMFLRWNRDFPPTAEEMRRNDLVEKFQGNRNPFIDDPSLADKIGSDALRWMGRGAEARGYEQSGRQAPVVRSGQQGRSDRYDPRNKHNRNRHGKRYS